MAQSAQMLFLGCPRCGTGLKYGGGRRKLECKNCGYHRLLGRKTDQVDHHPLKAGVSLDAFTRGLDQEMHSHTCENCGTTVSRFEAAPPAYCPFCRGESFEPSDRDREVIEPVAIIPFTISEQQARTQLAHRFRNRFLPNALQQLTRPAEIQGVYIPIFQYDALTRSTWKADATFRVVSKRDGVPTEKKIFEPSVGYYEHFFENVSIPFTEGMGDFFDEIADWDLSKTISYDPRFLRGWNTELYQVNELSTFDKADKVMSKQINDVAKKRAYGEDLKKMIVTSEKFALGFRIILVPVWIGVFHFQGEMYQYLINGQTGTDAGEQPLSNRKMLIAVGAAVFLMTLLGWVFG